MPKAKKVNRWKIWDIKSGLPNYPLVSLQFITSGPDITNLVKVVMHCLHYQGEMRQPGSGTVT